MTIANWKKPAAAVMAAAIALSPTTALPVYAASPSFARTEEEWAHLRDNTLEWYEIADLVHEYNASVLKNQEDLKKDERRNMDDREVREYYLDLADDLEALADSVEGAGSSMSAAAYRIQANAARSSADSSVTDFDIITLEYELVEKNTARAVQNLFLNYYKGQYARTYSDTNIAYLTRAYASAQNRKNVGMATEVDVLSAREALDQARAAQISTDASNASAYTNLIVMCGWSYDAPAEIGPLPELDQAALAALDYDADLAQAMANSYTLRMDEIKLKNARSSFPNLVSQYESQLQSDTDSFKVSFRGAYDTLQNASLAYSNLAAERALKDQDAVTAERRLSLGLISQLEYEAAINQQQSLIMQQQSAWVDLISAKAAYDAAIEGVL